MHALFNRKHYSIMSYYYKNGFNKNVCFLQGFDFGKLKDGVTIAQNMCGSTLVALTILIYDDSNLCV